MQLNYPILTISDTHIGHPATQVRDAEQLAPLFKDSATVVFNGDTAEMLCRRHRDVGQAQMEKVGAVSLEQNATPIFLNGNHDPVVSTANHLDLYNSAMLITHGDILFHDLAPWAREAEILGPAHTEILRSFSDEALADFEKRLFAVKEASISLEMHDLLVPRSIFAKVLMVMRECWPPSRTLRILKFWGETPQRAAMLAQIFRPLAKFVLIGHTHRAGIWNVDGRTIINTGSFLPFSGKLAVLMEETKVQVRKIVERRKEFVLGKTVAEFPVEAAVREEDERFAPRPAVVEDFLLAPLPLEDGVLEEAAY